MGASPTWDIEDDHLPAEDTTRGAALVYFAHLGSEALDRLGVVLIGKRSINPVVPLA